MEYFKVIDTALAQLTGRINRDGLNIYEQLENCLLTGDFNDACTEYPEICTSALHIQLQMFQMQFQYSSNYEAASAMRACVPEVRRMLNQVETLIRLLLVVPA